MQKTTVLLSIILMCFVSGCAQSPKPSKSNNKKILVAYYSYSGNTEEIAKQIQEMTGGDIFEILPVTSYPEEYKACTEQAKQEIESGYKPALKTKMDNIASYDIIFVGSPNWWSTIAPPVTTFLSDSDLSGKTVIPFCTHGGGGKARCLTDTEKLCPNSTVLEGFAISGTQVKSAKADLEKWLRDHKLID